MFDGIEAIDSARQVDIMLVHILPSLSSPSCHMRHAIFPYAYPYRPSTSPGSFVDTSDQVAAPPPAARDRQTPPAASDRFFVPHKRSIV